MLNAQVSNGRISAVLIGFESAGKSTLFRRLTGETAGDEANFRGSTVMARLGQMTDEIELVDLPGIRLKDDSLTTRIALQHFLQSDLVVLVVRATHVSEELPQLLEAVPLGSKSCMLVLTFEDKTAGETDRLADSYEKWLDIPVMTVDSRQLNAGKVHQLKAALRLARPIRTHAAHAGAGTGLPPFKPEIKLKIAKPQETWFEHKAWGRWLSLLMMLGLFAVPVVLAYLLSGWLQPLLGRYVLDPLTQRFDAAPKFFQSLFVGDYGMITLGLYSFVWAFPVVVLLGLSLAFVEETGLKDRIADSLDGPLRVIGLTGRDLIPVLSGFGCNVVAVFHSRACSSCTRRSCVSLIAFGSACSYQIGASLSIFGSSGHIWLFVPYLLVLFIAGAVHTRVWNPGGVRELDGPVYQAKTYLQVPSLRALHWRMRTVIKQFLLQAMPIFILICLAAALLEYFRILSGLSRLAGPLLTLFHLPAGAASGIIFSVIRKDGLLTLNQSGGGLLADMQTGQIFALVFLASTLTACLVTLWTVRKELGAAFAFSMAGKQLVTSIVFTCLIAWLPVVF